MRLIGSFFIIYFGLLGLPLPPFGSLWCALGLPWGALGLLWYPLGPAWDALGLIWGALLVAFIYAISVSYTRLSVATQLPNILTGPRSALFYFQ